MLSIASINPALVGVVVSAVVLVVVVSPPRSDPIPSRIGVPLVVVVMPRRLLICSCT